MLRVHKYNVRVADSVAFTALDEAKIIHVEDQHGQGDQLQIWCLVNPAAPLTERHLHIRGTGHDVGPDCGAHVGSTVTAGGELVWHVFEANPGSTT